MKALIVLALFYCAFVSDARASLTVESKINNSLFNSALKNIKSDIDYSFHKKIKTKIVFKLNKLGQDGSFCNYNQLIKVTKIGHYASVSVDPLLIRKLNNDKKEDCLHGSSYLNALSMMTRSMAKVIDKEEKISKKREFLHVSGWMKKGILFKRNTNLNQYKLRFFDESENEKPTETFAVNFELFLNDSAFSCRRSSLNDYFINELGLRTKQTPDCNATDLLILQSKKIRQQEELLKKLNTSKVYQIHYFFAGKGKKIMSRWGHSMFRVVMCPDERSAGPDCLNDVSNNFIISFAANIDELEMNYRKGINGSYASQMFIRPLMEVVNEYTVGEYRDVVSLPIKMNKEEMNRFVHKSLELFWAYKGQYYFFTNNCATETMNLLRSSLLDNNKVQKKSILTPVGLYKFLAKEKLINLALLDNKKEAIYNGYYYEGISERLNESLDYFGKSGSDSKMAFQNFEKLGGEKRLKTYQEYFEKEADINKKRLILGNAIRIEEKILQSLNILFEKEIIILLKNEASNGNSAADEIKKAIEETLKSGQKDLYEDGYGLPLESEMKINSMKNEQETVEAIILKNQKALEEMLKKSLPSLVEELGRTKFNKSELIYMMNQLLLKK